MKVRTRIDRCRSFTSISDIIGSMYNIIEDVNDCSPDEDGEEDSGSGGVCFSGDMTVLTEDGTVKRMNELKVGDHVLTSFGKYEAIYTFMHQLEDMASTMVKLSTNAGHEITLSPLHYLPIEGDLVPAKNVQPGQVLTLGNGNTTTVSDVTTVLKKGIYGPRTESDMIVVNNIVAGCSTAAMPLESSSLIQVFIRGLFTGVPVARWLSKTLSSSRTTQDFADSFAFLFS